MTPLSLVHSRVSAFARPILLYEDKILPGFVVPAHGVKTPWQPCDAVLSYGMNLLLLVVVLLLLFGGGGFYFGGPVIGGSGLGLVLLICLVVYLMGGFRSKS